MFCRYNSNFVSINLINADGGDDKSNNKYYVNTLLSLLLKMMCKHV